MPCHHALAEALHAYIDAAGFAEDRKGWLFRTAPGHKADALSDRAMNQYAAWLMIRRRAAAAGITARIGNHTFRATGITASLANGGALERERLPGGNWKVWPSAGLYFKREWCTVVDSVPDAQHAHLTADVLYTQPSHCGFAVVPSKNAVVL